MSNVNVPPPPPPSVPRPTTLPPSTLPEMDRLRAPPPPPKPPPPPPPPPPPLPQPVDQYVVPPLSNPLTQLNGREPAYWTAAPEPGQQTRIGRPAVQPHVVVPITPRVAPHPPGTFANVPPATFPPRVVPLDPVVPPAPLPPPGDRAAPPPSVSLGADPTKGTPGELPSRTHVRSTHLGSLQIRPPELQLTRRKVVMNDPDLLGREQTTSIGRDDIESMRVHQGWFFSDITLQEHKLNGSKSLTVRGLKPDEAREFLYTFMFQGKPARVFSVQAQRVGAMQVLPQSVALTDDFLVILDRHLNGTTTATALNLDHVESVDASPGVLFRTLTIQMKELRSADKQAAYVVRGLSVEDADAFMKAYAQVG